jgi:ATP-dependent DNA helicase DinG
MRHQLASIVEADSAFVAWVEVSSRAVQLSASPVNLAPTLRNQLFDVVPSVILTSATLADSSGSQGAYNFLRQRLGLDESMSQPEELVVPAPFDFARRSLLYVPNDLPAPAEEQFTQQAAVRASELIQITDGGAFVLTTSVRAMRELHAALSASCGDRLVLLQGEAPKHILLQRFREDGRAVLVATLSFWEGVDVPGQALRLVIMDKLPFAVPTDPILKARATALEQAGQSGFRDLYLPLAQRTLKQGFGRLLRHRDDMGVVAVLDPRLRQRGYGKKLLSALPPSPQVETLEAVREFWTSFGAAVSGAA